MKTAGFLGSPKVRYASVMEEFLEGSDALVLGCTSFVKYFVSPVMVASGEETVVARVEALSHIAQVS
jgi:hypothetical protein